jgi:hypothetical protein
VLLDTDAYVSTGSDIYHCTVVQATGTLSACALSDGTLTNHSVQGLALK